MLPISTNDKLDTVQMVAYSLAVIAIYLFKHFSVHTKLKDLFLRVVGKKEKSKLSIDLICDEKKIVVVFKETIVVNNQFELNNIFLKEMDFARKEMKTLIFDFSKAVTINEEARESIRWMIGDAVKKNSIKFNVIFPRNGALDKEYEYAESKIQNSCGSITVKIDDREEER